MLDKASVGYYSAALTISTLWSMIPSALIQSISPVLYEAAGKDRALYLRRLRQSYAVLFWLNAAYSIFVGVIIIWKRLSGRNSSFENCSMVLWIVYDVNIESGLSCK